MRSAPCEVKRSLRDPSGAFKIKWETFFILNVETIPSNLKSNALHLMFKIYFLHV